MTYEPLEYAEIKATGQHQHTLIWLHGLGADGHDLLPLANTLSLQNISGIRQIFPHAPFRQMQAWNDTPIRAWYRFDQPIFDRGENDADIRESIHHIETLVKLEHAALPPGGRLIMGGFSQGGLIALAAGLGSAKSVNGVVALSTYLWKDSKPSNNSIPVYMAHGQSDPIIPIAVAQASARRLEAFGIPVEWHEYAMAHSISQEEIRSLSIWLRHRLADNIIDMASTED
ncbi:alpha/beta hydrolase [Acidihalobacter prosperus]